MPKTRAKGTTPLGSVLHIFCEGEKTEPNYINAYMEKTHPENRLLVRVETCSKNTPVQLVEAAVSLKNHKDKPYHLNPYTLVHELLDGIDKFVKKNRTA